MEEARELLLKHLYLQGGDGLGISDRHVYNACLDAIMEALTTPVDVENKELPVYKVVFNEGSEDGVTSINLTKTPLFNAKQTGEHLRSSCDWCNPPQRK
jgi:hypothetical protein